MKNFFKVVCLLLVFFGFSFISKAEDITKLKHSSSNNDKFWYTSYFVVHDWDEDGNPIDIHEISPDEDCLFEIEVVDDDDVPLSVNLNIVADDKYVSEEQILNITKIEFEENTLLLSNRDKSIIVTIDHGGKICIYYYDCNGKIKTIKVFSSNEITSEIHKIRYEEVRKKMRKYKNDPYESEYLEDDGLEILEMFFGL